MGARPPRTGVFVMGARPPRTGVFVMGARPPRTDEAGAALERAADFVKARLPQVPVLTAMRGRIMLVS